METIDHIGLWFSHGLHIGHRSIYLENDRIDDVDSQEVSHTMTSRFIKSMQVLESMNQNPITVICNTPGGDEYAGFAIYDRIKESKCQITVRGYGHVMSMGSIIMQAADIRQMSPESYLMIHDGSNTVHDSSSKSILHWGKHLDYINTRMYEIFLEVMINKNEKLTLKKIENMCKHDTVYTAQETVDVGLADEIYYGVNE